MGAPLLWDVDTQVDFVLPRGKLQVPGADGAILAMRRMVRWAEEKGITHLATVDDHELTDPEISLNPDYVTTFPPHCLRGTPGAHKILATQQKDPTPFGLTLHIPELTRELVFLKKDFNAFTNPNLNTVLLALDPSEVIVFGVATDVCNNAAVIGLLTRGYKVAFVEDASRGLDKDRTAETLERWRDLGVRFTTSWEVTHE